MQYDISFIHTAQVHIKTFNALVDELSPNLIIRHIVDESLLSHAQKFGSDNKLQTMLINHVEALSKESKMVIVTCSSIGDIAEKIGVVNNCKIQRIDRAMADYAVKHGLKILVVAALESTLQPTRELLNSSISKVGLSPQVSFHHIKSAWNYFLSGSMDNYYHEIATVLTANEANYDLVVLAQASMAGVEGKVNLSIPIISSPRIGITHAIAHLSS